MAVRAGDRGGPVGGTTSDLAYTHLALKGIGQAGNHHAVMQERRVEAQDGGFLAAVLRGRAGEDAAHFADQSAFHPQLSRRIQELPHLAADGPETGGRSEEDAVVRHELVHGAHGDMGLLLLGLNRPQLLDDLRG